MAKALVQVVRQHSRREYADDIAAMEV